MISFCILANQRTGTHYLASTLHAHPDIAVETECKVFHANEPGAQGFAQFWAEAIRDDPANLVLARSGARLVSTFLETVVARNRKPICGVEIKLDQLEANGAIIGVLLARRIPIIHLFRRNLLRSVVSNEVARARGLWHAATPMDPVRITLNPDVAVTLIDTHARRNHRAVQRFSGHNPYLPVAYEDIQTPEKMRATLPRLHDFLGAAPEPALPPARYARTTPEPLSEIVTNLAEVRRAIDAAGLTAFCGQSRGEPAKAVSERNLPIPIERPVPLPIPRSRRPLDFALISSHAAECRELARVLGTHPGCFVPPPEHGLWPTLTPGGFYDAWDRHTAGDPGLLRPHVTGYRAIEALLSSVAGRGDRPSAAIGICIHASEAVSFGTAVDVLMGWGIDIVLLTRRDRVASELSSLLARAAPGEQRSICPDRLIQRVAQVRATEAELLLRLGPYPRLRSFAWEDLVARGGTRPLLEFIRVRGSRMPELAAAPGHPFPAADTESLLDRVPNGPELTDALERAGLHPPAMPGHAA